MNPSSYSEREPKGMCLRKPQGPVLRLGADRVVQMLLMDSAISPPGRTLGALTLCGPISWPGFPAVPTEASAHLAKHTLAPSCLSRLPRAASIDVHIPTEQHSGLDRMPDATGMGMCMHSPCPMRFAV